MVKLEAIRPGYVLPEREFKHTNVQSFMYNAALWNAHRIHFDLPYTTEVEGYPGLVIAGPLMGDWMSQCVLDWIGDEGQLTTFEYSNRKAAYIGDTLRSGGKVIACNQENGEVEVEVYIKNEADEIIVPGKAIIRF